MTAGETVRARREELGLGLRETARKVGISPTFLSRFELDRTTTGPPSGASLCRLAKVLGLDEFELCVAAGQAHPAALAAIRESAALARVVADLRRERLRDQERSTRCR